MTAPYPKRTPLDTVDGDAVLAGFNPTNSLNVGGNRAFPFVSGNKNPFTRSPVSFRDLRDDSHIGPKEKLRWGGIILRREVLHQMKVAG